MKFISARYALVVWMAIAGVSAIAQTPRAESDQDVLIGLERGWNDAVYTKNLAFIDSVLADDYTATYDDGDEGDRAKELRLVAVQPAGRVGDSGRLHRPRVHDTAVVRFTLRMVGIKRGQRTALDLRYADVWEMRDGRWRCVSSQSTRITPR